MLSFVARNLWQANACHAGEKPRYHNGDQEDEYGEVAGAEERHGSGTPRGGVAQF